ncbi:unnamed protein product [Mesocestoides corti]|uniref:Protein CDV3 homolog n=1 Tax=Mesocestoides corti TaxID=53468 RepID=A0A0R3UEA1_MESCO|nr:unnamed protein product [Mesocestoides corti]
MSLDDFFNKKSKKKSKKTINAQELFEKITDGPQRQKYEAEKNSDDVVDPQAEDTGEWEPIVNDDIELDFSNMRINDLSTAKNEEEQAVNENISAVNKSDDSKVVWGGKAKTEEPEAKEEKPSEPVKSGVYIPVNLRPGGAALSALSKPRPNLDSVEEFPTLDFAAQAKAKKPVVSEKQEDSWTEVSKSSSGHRMNEPASIGSSSAAFTNFRRDDAPPTKYAAPGFREYGPRYARDASPSRPSPSQRSGGWVRGEHVRSKQPPTVEQVSADKNNSSEASKHHGILHQRDILSFTQENRYAQLDNA